MKAGDDTFISISDIVGGKGGQAGAERDLQRISDYRILIGCHGFPGSDHGGILVRDTTIGFITQLKPFCIHHCIWKQPQGVIDVQVGGRARSVVVGHIKNPVGQKV